MRTKRLKVISKQIAGQCDDWEGVDWLDVYHGIELPVSLVCARFLDAALIKFNAPVDQW